MVLCDSGSWGGEPLCARSVLTLGLYGREFLSGCLGVTGAQAVGLVLLLRICFLNVFVCVSVRLDSSVLLRLYVQYRQSLCLAP